jgi:hypothetical protein
MILMEQYLKSYTMQETKMPAFNKNYITIGVPVLIAKFSARNNGVAARQESNPKSPTVYSSVR